MILIEVGEGQELGNLVLCCMLRMLCMASKAPLLLGDVNSCVSVRQMSIRSLGMICHEY